MSWKGRLFALLGKDPEAVVVSFWTGRDDLAEAMVYEIRRLVPDRRHFVVTTRPGLIIDGCEVVYLRPASAGELYLRIRAALRDKRIGLAPVLFDGAPSELRKAAAAVAPTRLLAYNANLERNHLKLSAPIASWLFLRGVPLDRIFLRPAWLFPFRRDRTRPSHRAHIVQGRPPDVSRPAVAVLSPYFPFPLSHGGAVRIYHLLREAAKEFDIYLFAFARDPQAQEFGPLQEFCTRITVVEPPHYREPGWSTLAPPEAGEFESPTMRRLVDEARRDCDIRVVQIEYTQLARYPGDVLVEHDVTWDLYQQLDSKQGTSRSWWDYIRWRWFETRALRRFRSVVVMSEKDKELLGVPQATVIPNGVDLARFHPTPEPPGSSLLFIGSFNHFPNIEAFRFFLGEVWPVLRQRVPEATLEVVAGRDHLQYWKRFTGTRELPDGQGMRLHGFVRNVAPLYHFANLVVVPTVVSAGTNLKVLEAMAAARAVVSTPSGCAGLGLRHGESVWIAEDPASFAAGIERLLTDPSERSRLAANARAIAERDFGWEVLGARQRRLWHELLARAGR